MGIQAGLSLMIWCLACRTKVGFARLGHLQIVLGLTTPLAAGIAMLLEFAKAREKSFGSRRLVLHLEAAWLWERLSLGAVGRASLLHTTSKLARKSGPSTQAGKSSPILLTMRVQCTCPLRQGL